MAKAASVAGYQTEVYHCGFDPDSLDMVIVRALDFAILIAPYPMNISRPAREMSLSTSTERSLKPRLIVIMMNKSPIQITKLMMRQNERLNCCSKMNN